MKRALDDTIITGNGTKFVINFIIYFWCVLRGIGFWWTLISGAESIGVIYCTGVPTTIDYHKLILDVEVKKNLDSAFVNLLEILLGFTRSFKKSWL